MSLSIITEGFLIECHVMASINPLSDQAYGENGMLFYDSDSENWWTSGTSINQSTYRPYARVTVRPTGSFNSFKGNDPNYEPSFQDSCVGPAARAQIGFPSSNVITQVPASVDFNGNVTPAYFTNSQAPSNLDLSDSGPGTIAFTRHGITSFAEANDGIIYNNFYSQYGEMPAGSTQMNCSGSFTNNSNNTITYNFPASFPLLDYESYSPWASDSSKAFNSVWISAYQNALVVSPGAIMYYNSRQRVHSGQFSNSAEQFFQNA
jgi:hypothetical protein